MVKFGSLLAAVGLATSVVGHGAVTSYKIGGTTYVGYKGFSPDGTPTIEWQWPDYNPTLDPSLTSVRCNGGTSAGLTATVAAGSTVTAYWAQWTHAQGSIAVYLYNCGSSFSGCTPTGANWFKIDEAGLLSGTWYTGTWGAGLVMNAGSWTSTIPSQLAPGNYLIRHELIAVHQTNTPQFYAECAQLVITGSGTSTPDASYKVAIPGYAKLSDANVSLDIYSDSAKSKTCWDVPGPAVWGGKGYSPDLRCNGASTGTPASSTPGTTPSSSTKPSSSSSSSTKPSSSSSTKPSSTATGGAPLYGQCGGQGWTGATTCASGTCKYSSQYYSQCLP